ncbi:AMP-binding protein [Nocardia jinanensis]|nr:AMP-binding protein [Nocardia jinanensis]
MYLEECAAVRPDEIALRDSHRALTWPEVDETVDRLVHALDSIALGSRRRVAVFAANCAELVLTHLGILHAGVSAVVINSHLTAPEVARLLRDSGAAALFAGPETAERAFDAARSAGVGTVIVWGIDGTPAGSDPTGIELVHWEHRLAASPAGRPGDDRLVGPTVMYTSGTTGSPKAVELGGRRSGSLSLGEHLAALRAQPMAQDGVHLVVGPLSHTGPLTAIGLLAAGQPVVVQEKFDAVGTLAAIEQYSVATSIMVPTHFRRLLDLPGDVKRRYVLDSLVRVGHTGSRCPVEVKRAMIRWWGPVFLEAYGATESGTVCTITSDEWLAHPGSVGRVTAAFRSAFAVDDRGNELAAGESGLLYFEDPTGTGIAYLDDPVKTAAAHLRPGVFTLGEIGFVDADGYVHLTDRATDLIVTGGVNVYPAEVEEILLGHPAIADAAVIAVPDSEFGESVHAVVVRRPGGTGLDSAAVRAYCRERLAGYKCPRTVVFADALPRNAMGKIDKRSLRASAGSRTGESGAVPGTSGFRKGMTT